MSSSSSSSSSSSTNNSTTNPPATSSLTNNCPEERDANAQQPLPGEEAAAALTGTNSRGNERHSSNSLRSSNSSSSTCSSAGATTGVVSGGGVAGGVINGGIATAADYDIFDSTTTKAAVLPAHAALPPPLHGNRERGDTLATDGSASAVAVNSTNGGYSIHNNNNNSNIMLLLSPSYRESSAHVAALHNDESERIYFDASTASVQDLEDFSVQSGHDDPAGAILEDDVFFDHRGGAAYSSQRALRRPLLSTGSIYSSQQQQQNELSGSRRRLRYNRPELNGLNYLNALTYAAHVFVSWSIGVWGLNGTLVQHTQHSNLETLVTPARWSYSLWIPILILEGIFAVCQLFPHYRARPIIQAGVGFFFFYTFVLQTAWTVFVCFQMHLLSFVASALALLSLMRLLASQEYVALTTSTAATATSTGFASHVSAGLDPWSGNLPNNNSGQSRGFFTLEYCLFRFPFYLHTGWMMVMVTDQFATVFRTVPHAVAFATAATITEQETAWQLASDIFSLGILLAVAAVYLAPPLTRHYQHSCNGAIVIPAVIVWSYIGIAWQLHLDLKEQQHGGNNNNSTDTDYNGDGEDNDDSRNSMVALYGLVVVQAMQSATILFAGTVVALLIPNIIVWLSREYCTINVIELEN